MSQAAPPVRMRLLLGWGVFGQLIYVASQFVTLLALTRFATVQEVGIYGLASAVVLPVFFFFDLNMRVNVAASARSGFSFQDFAGLLALSVCAGLGIVLLLGFVVFDGPARIILLLIGAAKAAESLSNLCYGVFQRYDRMALLSGSLAMRSLGGTVLFVSFLAMGSGVAWAFAAQFIVWSLVALGIDYARARRLWRANGGPEGRDAGRMRQLLRSALPLAFNGLISALQGNTPRFVIAGLLNSVALGQFTVVAYAMQAISTVLMAATQSLIARFSTYLDRGQTDALRKTLGKLFFGLTVFTVFSVGISLLIGDWLVLTVFGDDYSGLGLLLAICVLGASLRGIVLILQMCLQAARAFRLMLIIRIGSALVMLTLCTVGGLLAGLAGIAIGMCAALLVQVVALALAVRPLAEPDG
ncbi:MAG: oligosaccharide flippase family protein [Sulfitobacter sp.]|nr:oligosaccharide flippase family protein [Sulfitobacter sp.]